MGTADATNASAAMGFPALFFNEDKLPLTTPGTVGRDGRQYWLLCPLIPGRSEAWQPGQDMTQETCE
jgi:hypothetical protein